MNTVEVLGLVLGSGTIGAGIMKLLDRILAHKLERKDKAADEKRANMEKVTEDVADHSERIRCLEKEAERGEKMDQIILKALSALISHSITGNSTGEMRKVQKQLTDSIIDTK